jgi:CubicO group peptidase (beta-lactamase class C family)
VGAWHITALKLTYGVLMKKLNHNIFKIVILLSAILMVVGCGAQTRASKDISLDHWISHNMQKYHIVGVSVAVIKDYKIAWSKGFGYRDLAHKQPVTTDTMFNAASISKPLAAVAALEAFDQNKISLDKDINAVMTSWKIPKSSYTKNTPVTMRLLLAHSAGITDFRCKGYLKNAKHVPDIDQVLRGEAPANTPPVTVKWRPGTHYAYSPAGYMIVQRVLMELYHQPFPTIMNKLVLKPLNMQDSTFGVRIPKRFDKQIALPYLPNGKPMPDAPLLFVSQAAGGLWTTSNDLAKFVIAIERAHTANPDKVLTPSLVKTLLTPGFSNNMGTGIEVNLNRYGKPVKQGNYFSHSGWNSGYLGLILGNAKGGNGIAILLNTAPYMTYKGKVKQFEFIENLVKTVANQQHWPS